MDKFEHMKKLIHIIIATSLISISSCNNSTKIKENDNVVEAESEEIQIAGHFYLKDENSTLVLQSGGVLNYTVQVGGERNIFGKWSGTADNIILSYRNEFGNYFRMGIVTISNKGLRVISSESFVRDYQDGDGNYIDDGLRNIGKTGTFYKRL